MSSPYYGGWRADDFADPQAALSQVEAMCSQRRAEADTIDFKRGRYRNSKQPGGPEDALKCDAGQNDLRATVAAMVNTKGGIIVVGVATEAHAGTDCADHLCGAHGPVLGEQQLTHLLQRCYLPPLNSGDFGVRPFPWQDPKTGEARHGCVVFVPHGTQVPHQYIGPGEHNARYLKRDGPNNVPMLDSEIDALQGRRDRPKLALRWAPNKDWPFEVQRGPGNDDPVSVDIHLELANEGGATAQEIMVELWLPRIIGHEPVAWRECRGPVLTVGDRTPRHGRGPGVVEFGIGEPLHPGRSIPVRLQARGVPPLGLTTTYAARVGVCLFAADMVFQHAWLNLVQGYAVHSCARSDWSWA